MLVIRCHHAENILIPRRFVTVFAVIFVKQFVVIRTWFKRAPI